MARLFFGFAETPLPFYIGGFISTVGIVSSPVLKAMVSKLIEPNERGKVFAIVAVFNNASVFFTGILYSQV